MYVVGDNYTRSTPSKASRSKDAPVAKKPVAKPKKFFNPELQRLYDGLMADLNSTPLESSGGFDMGPIPEFVNARQIVEKAKKENKGKPLSKELASLERQITRADHRTKQMGSTVPKKTHPSLLERTIDVLSRGTFASANAFQDNIERGKKTGEHPLDRHRLGAGIKGFWEGLSGKEKTTFGHLRKDAGVDHGGVGNFSQDLTLDIFADPFTYLTLGTTAGVKIMGKSVTKAGRAKQAKQAADKTARKQAEDFAAKATGQGGKVSNIDAAAETLRTARSETPTPVSAQTPVGPASRVDDSQLSVPATSPSAIAQQASRPKIQPIHFEVANKKVILASPVGSVSDDLAERLKQVPLGKEDAVRLSRKLPQEVLRRIAASQLDQAAKLGLLDDIDKEALEIARFELNKLRDRGRNTTATQVTDDAHRAVARKKAKYKPSKIASKLNETTEDFVKAEIGAKEPARAIIGDPSSSLNIGRSFTDDEIRATKQYQDAIKKTQSVSMVQRVKNAAQLQAETEATITARQSRYADQAARLDAKGPMNVTESFPVSGLDDVPVEMRLNAEDEIIAAYERQSRGKKLFSQLEPAQQMKIMAKEKPALLEKVYRALAKTGQIDKIEVPKLTATSQILPGAKVVSEAAAKISDEATESIDVLKAQVDSASAALRESTEQFGKVPVAAVPTAQAPKAVISQHAAKPNSRKPQYNGTHYDAPPTPRDMEIVTEVAGRLKRSMDANQFNARYSNNLQKLIGARLSIVGRLLADRMAEGGLKNVRFVVGTEGLKLRSLQLLKLVEQQLDTVFVITPSGEPFRLIDQLERIPARELMELNTVEAIMRHDSVLASQQVSGIIDNIVQATANNIPTTQVDELVQDASEVAERAVVGETGNIAVGKAAGEAAGEAAKQSIRAIDDVTAKGWDVSDAVHEFRMGRATADEVKDAIKKQHLAAFEFIGVKIGWGVNPLLIVPVLPLGNKGLRQVKRIQKAQKAAAVERNYDQNYNSLLEAVRHSGRAFAMLFNNAYGLSAKLHQVRVSSDANLANRVHQSADAVGKATNKLHPQDRYVALSNAQTGARTSNPEINKVSDFYEQHLEWLLGKGGVLDRAGITDRARVLAELSRTRPRPGAKPLEMDDTLDWRKVVVPLANEMDANHIVVAIETAVHKAVTDKIMADQVVTLFGTPKALVEQNRLMLAKGTGRYLASVDSQGKAIKYPPEFAGVAFPYDIAEQLEFLYKKLDQIKTNRGKGPNPILRTMDIVMGKWKAGVTIYNPAFHIRNAMGDAFTGALNGVGPIHYRTGAKALSRHGAKRGGEIPPYYLTSGGFDSRQVFDYIAPEVRGSHPVVWEGIVRSTNNRTLIDVKSTKIDGDELMQEYLQRGLRQNIAVSEMLTEANQATHLLARVGRKGRDASEYREDFFRMAHFVKGIEEGLKKGMSKEEAFAYGARLSKKFHADYSDLTEFERNVMRRVIPFYTWQRRMMPVIVESIFTQPGRMAMPSKFMRDYSAATGQDVYNENNSFPQIEAIVPQWMREGVLWPIGRNAEGNMRYADPGNPFHDLFRQNFNQLDPTTPGNFQPVKTFMQQTNPGLRIPLELSAGRQFFGDGNGMPIDPERKNLYYDQQIPIMSLLNRLTNTSTTGTLDSLMPGGTKAGIQRNQRMDAPDEQGRFNVEQLLNLTAAGIQENTEDRQAGELRRQQDISTAAKKKATEEYYRKRGKKPPVQRNY